MRRYLLGILAIISIVLGGAVTLRSEDHQVHAAICNATVPLGAIAPAVPEWCAEPLAAGIDTHVEGSNAWLDDFNHGQTHATLNASYARGEANGGGMDIIHFQHNNHWMVDVQGDNGQYPTLGAAWMRPNRTFNTEGGKLVIEFEVASPIAGTRNVDGLSDAWPEFTITADPVPGNLRQNGTYLYETFAGFWAFGCRMQQSKHPICSLYQPADGPPAYPYRRWEINQNGGDVASEVNGGTHVGTGDAIDVAWKGCTSAQDPDTICRNFHRVEITATTIKFFVNGVPGYSAVLINNELGNILNAPFYVYYGDFAYRISQDVVVRFHWDHLAVNPEALGTPSTPTPVPPTSTPTNTPLPTNTPAPTNTPTNTPTPGAATPTPGQSTTLTFNGLSGQNRVLNGTAEGINWGTNQWYLSGPWSVHTSKSVSFNGMAASKSFAFTTPKVLVSLKAGGVGVSTITLSCAGNPTKTQTIPANTLVTITTGWTVACTTVTVGSSNGWDTNFDDFVVQ